MTRSAHLADNFESCRINPKTASALSQHVLSPAVSMSADPTRPFLGYGDTSIYDVVDPIGVVEAEVAAMAPGPALDLVVLFGFGLGLHAKAIFEKYKAPIIVFEPDLDLLKAGLSFQRHRIPRLTVVHREPELIAAIDTALFFTERRLLAGVIPAYKTLFESEFERFKKVVDSALDTMEMLDGNLAVRGEAWSRNAVENIPRFAPLKSVEILKDACRGVPGIIVGTGPSLDKNIDVLKAAKGRALICAANSAVKPLVRSGVTPEMVALIEANRQMENFEEVPRLDRMVMVMLPETHPDHFSVPVAHKLNMVHLGSAPGDWIHQAYGHRQMPSGGSVACTAMSVLYLLGCDPIILVGMDTAFTDVESHSRLSDQRGVNRFEYKPDEGILERYAVGGETPEVSMRVDEVTAWGGEGTVLTYDGFTIYRRWFESAAETWASDRRFVNATEGGARYVDVEEMTLREAIEAFCHSEEDLEARIMSVIHREAAPDVEPLFNEIAEEGRSLKKVAQLSKQALITSKKAIGLLRKGKIKQAKGVLAALEKQEGGLGAASRSSRLLYQSAGPRISAARAERMADVSDDPVKQALNALNRSVGLFTVLNTCAGELFGAMDASLRQARREGANAK